MAVYKKALKDNDKATIATIHTEVNNWYTKYRDDIERVEGRGVCLKNNQMLRVSAYCKIMQVNQGRFSWGDYDFINYCRAFEHINKVLICVYPNVKRSDDHMGVYVHVPKSKFGKSLSKQFVQNSNTLAPPHKCSCHSCFKANLFPPSALRLIMSSDSDHKRRTSSFKMQ